MMGNFKSFVLGKDAYPDWFIALDKQNKITYERDSLGALLRVRIQNPTGTVRIDAGDTVVNTGNSIIKLSESIMNKYAK